MSDGVRKLAPVPASTPFPGPTALGRGLVVAPDDEIPAGAADWPSLRLDADTLVEPSGALGRLDDWFRRRTSSVVVLAIPFADLKQPESIATEPHELDPSFEFARERLHFLTWINRYDGRGGDLRWHHGERAALLDGVEIGGESDIEIDGKQVWVDGGPRTSTIDSLAIVHVESVWSGQATIDLSTPPSSDLAPDQLAAVSHPGGPARIIAPAGSGKTRVLTERMHHLLVDRGWNVDAITALAYNRRAAGEMSERLGSAPGAHVRTLHAFGYEILGHARGGRPRVLNERDIRRTIEKLVSVRHRSNEDVVAPYIEALGEVRTALRSPEEIEAERDDVPGFGVMFGDYRHSLRGQNAIDHDEQIYGAVEALLADPDLRAWAHARCRHLLVDEFQDLTAAHLLMVRLLAAPEYDVFGVGDDDQVIYGYSGASPEFLIDYSRFFPGAGEYQLEVNYRCPAPVVEAASTLLSHNQIRVPKSIVAASQAPSGLEVERVTESAMGTRLVSIVSELVARDGAESVAVLTRVNVGLLVPQVSLSEADIATNAAVDLALLDRSGVRAALAWLRLGSSVAHAEPMMGVDLAEAIRRPPRSLSPGVRSALGSGTWTAERLASFAAGSDNDRTRTQLGNLVDDIRAIAEQVADGASIATVLEEVRDSVGLGSVLDRFDHSRVAGSGGHGDDLDALIVLAHTHPEVEAFEPWLRTTLERPPPGAGVTLSTVHRVKGLEWPHVVVWDASTGMMPHRLASNLEEERRIFHVAITRGAESVTVMTRASAPSPFVAQMHQVAPKVVADRPDTPARPATTGMSFRWQGFDATVVELAPDHAVVTVGSASRMRVPWGETVTIDGARIRLESPPAPAVDGRLLDRLRDWRRDRANRDGVPAYVVAHDAHLASIASRVPTTLEDLARCDGIGPSRLDRYGDEILDVVGAPT